jgi:hypothetical protein
LQDSSASSSGSVPNYDELKLRIDQSWLKKNRELVRGYWCALSVGLGAEAILGALLVFRLVPSGNVPIAAVVGISLLFLEFLLLWAADLDLTHARRFVELNDAKVTADIRGVRGEAYPPARYKAIRTEYPKLRSFPGAAAVIPTRIFHRVAEVSEVPNFSPWKSTSFVIDKFDGALGLQFWTEDSREENSVFHGVICRTPEKDLPALVVMALSGGADVHVSPALLSEIGLGQGVACLRHERVLKRFRSPRRTIRLRLPQAASDATRWFHAGVEST